MNEEQFKLVKLFLDGFKVPADKLARKWKIDKKLVYQVQFCPNYELFVQATTNVDAPLEDIMSGLV